LQDASKLNELKEEIRYLNSVKAQVLPAHLNTYFPRDLENFLKHSTSSQLQTYANNYGPAIKLSIRQNKDQSVANTRNILTYQGFHRITTSNQNPTTPPQEENRSPTIQQDDTANSADIHIMEPTPPILPPPDIPPPAPNEITPTDHATTTVTITLPYTQRQKVQQSILSTFRRRRNIREITSPQIMQPVGTPINHRITQHPRTAIHQTAEATYQTPHHHPPLALASTTDTEDPTTSHVTATRASFNYKHSEWRSAALVREKFSQYFRK
jgi:hypothetical protein